MTLTLAHYIDGARIGGAEMSERRNPSDTAEVVARFPIGGAAEIGQAVEAARRAFPAWRALTAEARSDYLDRVGRMLIERSADLGRLLSREEGKLVSEGVAETVRAGRVFRYFAGEALRVHGQTLGSPRAGVEVETYREPLGVVGLITPWNFPIAIPAWKSAPALAFGNTVVLKPSGLSPVLASELAGLMEEAGVPKGVFNLVYGDAEAGSALVNHPDVAAISFTGSQAVGSQVAVQAAARQARVQLEMGGKNPLVVLDDADLDRAVMLALDGSFFASGQRCTASSRIIVTERIHDAFAAELARRAGALRVGHALDPQSQMGPQVSEAQLEKSVAYSAGAAADGASILCGGQALQLATPGYYMAPTLIADTRPDMRINCEEVFGPVAALIRVRDFDEALDVANATRFGLSAGIVTQSLSHARRFRAGVRAGMVMINLPTAGVDYHAPFGGVASSSYGQREQGYAAVEFYTQVKTAYVWS
ncbi:MAG: aldehyde dehydrogenase family protein [Alphaproteobacteria bacterium]|nr:aldehyde dehydrogenase family protein [Alphaproteobacteria bacterium]